jgi:hypothetical protein
MGVSAEIAPFVSARPVATVSMPRFRRDRGWASGSLAPSLATGDVQRDSSSLQRGKHRAFVDAFEDQTKSQRIGSAIFYLRLSNRIH